MNTHPLSARSLAVGAVAALGIIVATSSFLNGFAIFTLAVIVGLTWRRDEVPVLPFLLSYQWLQVTSGYFFYYFTGVFPDVYEPGNLEYAVALGLLGLLTLSIALRLVSWFSSRHEPAPSPRMEVRNLRGLLFLVLALYSINYVTTLNVGGGSLSVIFDRLLQLRQVPLLLLWIEVVRQNRHRSYLWISLAWVFIPQLGSYFSDFKTPLMLLVIVSAYFWEPWAASAERVSLHGLLRVGGALGAAVCLAMIWQAGVKQELRRAYDADTVSANPLDRVELFVSHARDAVPVVMNDPGSVVEGLVSRISYVTFFSRVLEHVPNREPFANGELLQMAFSNAFMPRFLFPDKGALPSDSYFTRRFAGALVMEEGTSISIGYMAEFYADWGTKGMFISVFAYGLLMGLAVWLIRLFAPSFLMNPALVATMLSVLPFEHQFVKGLATLLMATALALLVTNIAARPMVEFLDIVPEEPETGVPAAPVAPLRPTLRPMQAGKRAS